MFRLFIFPQGIDSVSSQTYPCYFNLNKVESYDSEESAITAFYSTPWLCFPGPVSKMSRTKQYTSNVSLRVEKEGATVSYNPEEKICGEILELNLSVEVLENNIFYSALVIPDLTIIAIRDSHPGYYFVLLGEDEFLNDLPVSKVQIFPTKESALRSFYLKMIEISESFGEGYAPTSMDQLSCQPSTRIFKLNIRKLTLDVSKRNPSQKPSSTCFDLHYGTAGGLHMDIGACLIPIEISFN